MGFIKTTLYVHLKPTKYMKTKEVYIVTGSSGFVASDLIPRLNSTKNIYGIDTIPSKNTNLNDDIASSNCREMIRKFKDYDIYIINLAAARFDFGAKPQDYFNKNVESTKSFLESLKGLNIKKFIHISSVASFDGEKINYSNKLSCDDAYRSTKYIQQKIIIEWCAKNNILSHVLYPSAIFANEGRDDTNIGKLQKLTKILPFIPYIPSKKSLTYLPFLSNFICHSVKENIEPGHYLTIENPIYSVSEIVKILSRKNLHILKIPFLKTFLYALAGLLYAIGGFGYFDLKLTPNRVTKLFKNTDYLEIGNVNRHAYNSFTKTGFDEIFKLD